MDNKIRYQHIAFELQQDGKDQLTIIAPPEIVKSFLSRLSHHFKKTNNDPKTGTYFTWTCGKFNKTENVFEFKTPDDENAKDVLTILAPSKSLSNIFTCLIEHFQKDPQVQDSNYLFRYRGTVADYQCSSSSPPNI